MPCHAVIEAVFADLEVKHGLYTELETKVTENGIIALNTASLPISSLGPPCKYQNRFAGMHFFNPVPLMRLVKVIRGTSTEDWEIEAWSSWESEWAERPSWFATIRVS